FRLADVPGVAAEPKAAADGKCDRCWRKLPEVGQIDAHPALCGRCADVVERLPPADDAAA
ncbi:MAG: zinc finger domain-containing protein, partial [Alphaproteobacteria bacterium]